ncbi:unnamed protein product [Amaranthus hypochondriacus]
MAMSFIQFLEKFPSFDPISILILFTILCFLHKWIPHAKNRPPCPPKLPILGNLHQLGKLPHRSLHSLSQKHGDFMLIYIGSKPTLIVSSAESAQEIMKTHDIVFSNRPKLKVAYKILYNGKDLAFASYGEYWRQMKSLCMLNVFSNTKVRSFRRLREEEGINLVEKIKRLMEETEQVNLSEIFASLASDVICRAAFGRKYIGEEGCANLMELLLDFSEALGSFCMEDFIPWLWWIDWLSGVDRKADKVARELDQCIEKIVQEHVENAGNTSHDFVHILLELQKENSDILPKESVKAILLDMLAGGTDTTYTLLEWTMTELLTHPRVLKQVQDEVRRNSLRGVNEDDLKEMKYLKCVIKETLRLHPPLPLLLFRESSQDVRIKGYDIGANTQVIINAWAIQRDSSYWDNADEFYPERFLHCLVDFKGQDFEFIPFGAGRRGCPGMAFGLADAEFMLATLLLHFDWKLPEGKDFNVIESAGTTIRKRDPLFAIPIPYNLQESI